MNNQRILNKEIIIQAAILIAFLMILMFPGWLYALRFLDTNNLLTGSQSPYYTQYGNTYNYAYGNYFSANNYRPYGPYLMPSTSYNSYYGYRTNYDSHMYIDNVLDYTYYTNPQLLEPRYIDNHQWYARGLWPQHFLY
jgi:hypothetical protein